MASSVEDAETAVGGLSLEEGAAPTKASASSEPGKPTNETQKQQDAGGKKKKKGNDKKQQPAPKKVERDWTPELQEDYERILTVGEECISAAELKSLILNKGRGTPHGFNLYDGFEPSGRMHIAQGVFKAMNVNKCTFEGTNSTFVFWVADWFALMNDKMGGDLDKIKTVGKYLIEVWKAAGMDLSNVEFKWASEEITNHADIYWPTMLDVARRFNITRIKKCCQIMGRLEGALTSAQVLYPLMQCTDVFFLKADICQLGVDQRKVNMLAREYCDAARIKRKPVILSHHMLYGLKAGQEKMSKSDPDSAVFMEDTAEDVERKIMAAYCPSKEQEADGGTVSTEEVDAGKQSMHLTVDTLKNPCLDYIENIIFSPPGATFTAGDTTYTEFPSVKAAFLTGDITEEQLKRGLINELNLLLEPVRTHFGTDENAKALLAQVQQYKKESLEPKGEKEVRRLDLVSLGKAPLGSHVVFAPFPSATPTLQQAVDVLAQLELNGESDQPLVLFLSDWTARVCNCCDADAKVIAAYYTVLLSALNSIDPDLMARVNVIYQSEAILCDPSNYWISVINVGRHFMLNDVMGPEMKDSDGVGKVIGRLMQVADVMGLQPASIALSERNVDSATEKTLIDRYYNEKLGGAMAPPKVLHGDGPVLALQAIKIEAHKTENDEYFLLDDPKVHGKSKMKKAFCQAGNTSFCPPIELAVCFGLERGAKEIVVNRSEENGGNVTYTSRVDMESDFGSEALHPGDLKAASSIIMVETLNKITTGVKTDGDVTKASKALKAFQKKKQKSKK